MGGNNIADIIERNPIPSDISESQMHFRVDFGNPRVNSNAWFNKPNSEVDKKQGRKYRWPKWIDDSTGCC